MNNLEKEFVLYPEALELKPLGFDEPCFGYYWIDNKELVLDINTPFQGFHRGFAGSISAPTYSQAFRWFRKKGYRFSVIIDSPLAEEESHYIEIWFEKQFLHESHYIYKTYEEAELACLRKLIQLVKQKLQ